MNQFQPLAADDPRRLGAFDIVARLGEGGQGVVYLGKSDSGEQVAVKLLHHALVADTDARTRFLREVAVAQRVARFCTAPVLHADLDGSRPYIVSEYVPGPSLRELVINEGPRRGAALERLAISTATALAAIHRAGILHRDFKPANVLMGPEGPVVIDFGIARALDSPGATATGMAMGTPSYLAPEQLSGAAVSEAADVFAWGVTMVFAATGKPAFGADSIPVVMNRILNEEPELEQMEGGVLGDLVAACLSKDPAQRPSADELIVHLTGQPAPNAAVEPITGRQKTAGAAAAGAAAAHAGGGAGGAGGPKGAGGSGGAAGSAQDNYPGPWHQPTGPVAVGGPQQTGPQSVAPPQTGDYGHAAAAAQGGPAGHAPQAGAQAGAPHGGQGAPLAGAPQTGPLGTPPAGPHGAAQAGPQGGPHGAAQGGPQAGMAPGAQAGMGQGGQAGGAFGAQQPGGFPPGAPQPPHGPAQGGIGMQASGMPHGPGVPPGGPFPGGPGHPGGPGAGHGAGGPSAGSPAVGGPGAGGPGSGGPGAGHGAGGQSGDGVPAKQRRTLTLALSGAAAAALLVVAGAVVVQANSGKEVPVVAVGNTSEPDGGSGAGQPGEPPESVPIPTDSTPPVPTLDIEEKKTRKPTREPVAQVPNPATQAPRPQTTTSRPQATPTKKKSRNMVEPDPDPSTRPFDEQGKATDQPAKPSQPPLKPNTATPVGVCGAGYKVINSHKLGEGATTYLLYHAGAGKNCVVTISRMVIPGKVNMNAILQVKGGSSGSNPGKFTSYAGPVRLAAKKKCVIWGGTWHKTSWKSGWSHCT